MVLAVLFEKQYVSVVNAVKYATAAASIAVTRKGAQDSMPYAEEIEEQIKKLL